MRRNTMATTTTTTSTTITNTTKIHRRLVQEPYETRDKQLVLVAGAEQTGIGEFFYRNAAEPDTANGLAGWEWPTLREGGLETLRNGGLAPSNSSGHGVFDLLFRETADGPVQQVLMDGIRDAWKNSGRGIVLGAESFLGVGVGPEESGGRAPKTVYRLMENLSLRSGDVTLVLVYGTPRIREWASVWLGRSSPGTYEDFLCGDAWADQRLEHSETTMNPFRVAEAYLSRGWNVFVLDEAAARASGLDPAHVLACEALEGVSCEGGWIAGLEGETSGIPPSYEIDGLDRSEESDLEKLFLARDCCYRAGLASTKGSGTLRTSIGASAWKDCRSLSCGAGAGENLTDPSFFLRALRSQKGCGGEALDLSGLLTGGKRPPDAAAPLLPVAPVVVVATATALSTLAGLLVWWVRHRWRSGKPGPLRGASDGLFSGETLGRPGGPAPPASAFSGRLCNACRFVRADPACVFCGEGTVASPPGGMGREIERRTRECLGRAKGRTDRGGRCPVDASHFDTNLRKTRHQSRSHKRKQMLQQLQVHRQRDEEAEEGAARESRVVRKPKELLVTKTETGEKIYEVAERESSALWSGPCEGNPQAIVFENDERTLL
ncbi:unnamed protein product [Pseudo-nitzschia multistriata]|uniref:Uncharacterized protein n=1 Tax=Pseudo-nitzschia multistriata TaxID=183589 RepID=A0A448YW16_9STRA|nr:unnamed protein product [Pseudo-nitzschia multistriata]